MKNMILILGMLVVSMLTACAGRSVATHVYPAQGQTTKQIHEDHWACRQWADQAQPRDPGEALVTGAVSGAAMGAGVGALVGAMTYAIYGLDAGSGAGFGAALGAMEGGTYGAVGQVQGEEAAYWQAWTACMEGRGYTTGR